jgi:phosphotriesterase-related protein
MNNSPESTLEFRPIHTVLGELPFTRLGIVDTHTHAWIEPVQGADPTSPVLDQYGKIYEELKRYRLAGGSSLLDCQPGGCGRNANRLIQLSRESGVNIIACTGFHRRKYYAPDYWLFHADIEDIADYFIKELCISMEETDGQPEKAVAGFIKIALEAEWESTPQKALMAAIIAARETGALVEIHTEKGALAEKVVSVFEDNGVRPQRLVICHIDKQADFELHSKLASVGVLLEYDTFYRPKYRPEENLWPLIQKMVHHGLVNHIALANDMAEAAMYRTIANGPGLESLPGEIKDRLLSMGCPENSIRQMLGENIARRLAGIV